MILEIESRVEPFVDHYLIDKLDGAALIMHRPTFADRALTLDKPWEGRFSSIFTVMYDAERQQYLMYYRGWPDVADDQNPSLNTCVAVSEDGIAFTRLPVNRIDFQGHTQNNIILYGQSWPSANFAPFIDTRPGVPAEQRFKAFAGLSRSNILAYASADGLVWKRMRDEPVIACDVFAFDSQNIAFWSQREHCYVAYFRTWHKTPSAGEDDMGVRWVSRATSDDFLNWSTWEEIDTGSAPYEELYTHLAQPYFRAPHIYFALGGRFQPERKVITDEQASLLGIAPDYINDCSDVYFMTSRSGNQYDRTFMQSVVRPGPGLRNWASRTNYPAMGIVQTSDTQMSIYIQRHYGAETAHLDRYIMRLDGLASVNAPYEGGTMVTKPFTFSGRTLTLNYATSAAGHVRVQIETPGGKPLAGHALNDCDPLVGDHIGQQVRWQGKTDLGARIGEPVRLRFDMKDADLYAVQFTG